jgi:hypothetical protein
MTPRRAIARLAPLVALAAALLSGFGASGAKYATRTAGAQTASAAPDYVAPTVDATEIVGHSGAVYPGETATLYAATTDTGNPASGVATVSADLSELGADSNVALSPCTGGCGPGNAYEWKTTFQVSWQLTEGSTKAYSVRATDNAGNQGSPRSGTVSVLVSPLPLTAGPGLLRDQPATAPQLTNSGSWQGSPILISGAVAYRQGELIYQDWLFDDKGAKGSADNQYQPAYANSEQGTGTYTYPSSGGYYNNAADIVEVRLKRATNATLFRVTFNSLQNPDLVGFTIALGGSSSPTQNYPFNANVSGPADLFVTVHGTTAVVTNGPVGATASASWDASRKQFTVTVPDSTWQPPSQFKVAVGAGLWDAAGNKYLTPAANRTASQPGGAGSLTNPPAFFNVAFRTAEPSATDTNGTNVWRENQQANQLANHTMAPFTYTVDLSKLTSGATDNSQVPTTGPMDQIMSSHYSTGTGVDRTVSCDGANGYGIANCSGQYKDILQPFYLYVPSGNPARYGLTILLHAHDSNYNQYYDKKMVQQLATQRGAPSIVLAPEARASSGSYQGILLADVFEAWATVAARYPLDSRYTAISGYSMGSGGAFRVAQAYPDLFAAAFTPTGANQQDNRLDSLRNVPWLQWNCTGDAYVSDSERTQDIQNFSDSGYRFEHWVFTNCSGLPFVGTHLALAINDEWGPAASWLGTRRLDPNPYHVTYVVNPLDTYSQYNMKADHAYWVKDASVRTVGGDNGFRDTDTDGVVDAFSYGFGKSDPTPSGKLQGSGQLTGGNSGTLNYTKYYQTWGPDGSQAVQDKLNLELTNIASVTIDVDRAQLSCNPQLHVAVDGNTTVRLVGKSCDRTLNFSPPDTSITSGPADRSRISSSSATFGFSSNPSGLSFECRIDSAPWTNCTSPYQANGLSNGDHRFYVRSVTAAGVVDGSPATRRFFVANWTGQTGKVFTLAGDGSGAFVADGIAGPYAGASGPDGIVALSGGSYVWSDRNSQRVRKIAPDGTVTTIAGNGSKCNDPQVCGNGGPATSAMLNTPEGVAVDASGRIFFADLGDHQVRRINSDGKIVSIAGNNNAGTCSTTGSAAVPPNGAAGVLTSPHAVLPLPDGSFLIADTGNGSSGQVCQVTPDGATIKRFVTTDLSSQRPTGLALLPDGSVLVALFSGNKVCQVPAAGGACTDRITGLNQPVGVWASGNQVYVADYGNNVLKRYSYTAPSTFTNQGVVLGSGVKVGSDNWVEGAAATSAAVSPRFVTVDPSGNIVVTTWDTAQAGSATPAGSRVVILIQ